MTKETPPNIVEGQCPSCEHQGQFKYIGTQHWQKEIADRMRIPTEVALYQCENCLTTVSAPLIQTKD